VPTPSSSGQVDHSGAFIVCLSVGDRDPRADCQRGELIDRIAATAPVRPIASTQLGLAPQLVSAGATRRSSRSRPLIENALRLIRLPDREQFCRPPRFRVGFELRRGASTPQITAALNEAGFRNRRGERFEYPAVYGIMRDQGIIKPKTRSGAGAKSDRTKPNGNPTIGAASSSGVSAVLQRKLRDAERVQPIIAHLISHQGCSSYRRIADALNYLAVEAPRGGHWHPSSVKNAMSAVNMTLASVCGDTVVRDLKPAVAGMPVRPNRRERQAVRRLYQLPSNRRGRVQRALPDILFMRDRGMAADNIARVLCLGLGGVKAVLKRYPRWEIDDPAVIEQVLARYAAGEEARKIARALGLELRQVRRVIELAQRRVKRPRKSLPPHVEDRRARILALRRQGKTGPEIYAELGIDTERERQQIRRFLQWHARREPGLALRNTPVLTDEIAAAKSEAKLPEDYIRRDDYYLLQYWADKWNSPPPQEVVQVAELLQEGQPITEIVVRTGLSRGRVKYIRSALRDGRMRAGELAAGPPPL
jgi:hypothetical protein